MSLFQQAVKSASSFELPPSGAQLARTVALIDLGTHVSTYQGEAPRPLHKLFVCWELPAAKRDDGRSHVVAREFTWSLSSNGALRPFLEQWLSCTLRDGDVFDYLALVGQPCLLSIAHQTSKDRRYAKVTGALPVPAGLTVPEATLPAIVWEIESGNALPDADWLPYVYGRPVADKIKESAEWRQRVKHDYTVTPTQSTSDPF